MRLLLLAMWVGWLAYWAIAARGAKATQWREPLRANWLHYTLAWIGTIVLLVPRATPAILAEPFLPPSMIGAVLGILLTALGLGIAIAARITLAGNWSAAVEIKEGHALIRSGPYRYVRHPIYSGLLLAVLGSAIAIDRWRALLGFALIFASLWLKSRHEERRLRQVLPEYGVYTRETAALIPSCSEALTVSTYCIDAFGFREIRKTRQPQYLVFRAFLATKCCCKHLLRSTGF